MEQIEIPISMSKQGEKWVISIGNVTSGFTVHTEVDSSRIEFKYDAQRFKPHLRIR